MDHAPETKDQGSKGRKAKGPFTPLQGASAVLILGVIAYSVGAFIVRDGWKDLNPGKLFSSDKMENTVVARAWVEPQSAMENGVFRCWISLQNLTDEAISDLGFATVRRFHVDQGKPVDVSNLERGVNDALARSLQQPIAAGRARSTLAPGERTTFWTEFQTPESEGEYEFLLIYGWKQPAKPSGTGLIPVQNSLLVGPLEVPGAGDTALRIGNSFYTAGKEVGLPIVLLLLTVAFQRWSDRNAKERKEDEDEREEKRKEEERIRDERLKQEEEAREEKRKQEEKVRDQIRETLARMLIISRRETTKFYLPLLAEVNSLETKVEKKDSSEWQDEAFFHLMTFFRIMKRLKEENGGLYLKSHNGEDIVSRAWPLLRDAAKQRFTPKVYAAAVDEVPLRESYAVFEERMAVRPKLKTCQDAFVHWLMDSSAPFNDYLPLLRVFYLVLSYEVNRPLVYWYGEAEEPPTSELTTLSEVLLNGRLSSQVKDAKLDSYLEKYQAEIERDFQDFNTQLQRTWVGQAAR